MSKKANEDDRFVIVGENDNRRIVVYDTYEKALDRVAEFEEDGMQCRIESISGKILWPKVNRKKKEHPAKEELIVHPSHYGGDTVYEAIKVIKAWRLGFNLGNVVKYIARWDKKGDRIDNLKKARFYLDEKIKDLEAGIEGT